MDKRHCKGAQTKHPETAQTAGPGPGRLQSSNGQNHRQNRPHQAINSSPQNSVKKRFEIRPIESPVDSAQKPKLPVSARSRHRDGGVLVPEANREQQAHAGAAFIGPDKCVFKTANYVERKAPANGAPETSTKVEEL